jgi:hypothetical protein
VSGSKLGRSFLCCPYYSGFGNGGSRRSRSQSFFFRRSVGWPLVGSLAAIHSHFAERARYHARYLDFHPSRRGFALSDISLDVDYLLLGLNKMVFVASLFAGAILLFQAIPRSNRFSWAAAATASYMFAILGFLLLAYVTKRQPVWLPRYGLFGFVLGLPLLAWLLQWLVENSRPVWLGRFAVGAVILLCAGQMQRQIPIVPKVLNDFAAHQHAAGALVAHSQNPLPSVRCFSDDVAVRVLSGLPATGL